VVAPAPSPRALRKPRQPPAKGRLAHRRAGREPQKCPDRASSGRLIDSGTPECKAFHEQRKAQMACLAGIAADHRSPRLAGGRRVSGNRSVFVNNFLEGGMESWRPEKGKS
jgi:hypothetical protein